LADLRAILNSHVLIEDMTEHMTGAPYEEVIPGTEVELTSVRGEKRVYTILGFDESDPPSGIVSYLSPIGSALLEKQIGDVVTLPGGGLAVEYEIVNIRKSAALGVTASARSK
jgi:transcription elongation GreA/GreB family factor